MKIYLYIFFPLSFFSHFFSLLLFFPRSIDLPKFGEPLQNLTIPVGREALLSCVVDNLQTYKVIEILFSSLLTAQTGDYAIFHALV